MLVGLWLMVVAVVGASPACKVSGRYGGQGTGFAWDRAANASTAYHAVGTMEFDATALTVSGTAFTIVNAQWVELVVDGSFAVAETADVCEITLQLTVANAEHTFQGVLSNKGALFVAETVSGSSVTWQLRPAPARCSAASVSGTYAGLGTVYDASAPEPWSALAGAGKSQGDGTAQVSYALGGATSSMVVEFEVDANCTLNVTAPEGFLGAVFNTGLAVLGPLSATQTASALLWKNAK